MSQGGSTPEIQDLRLIFPKMGAQTLSLPLPNWDKALGPPPPTPGAELLVCYPLDVSLSVTASSHLIHMLIWSRGTENLKRQTLFSMSHIWSSNMIIT